MEYNPKPPFNCGSPATADKAVLEKILLEKKDVQAKRKEHILSLIQ
jgi:hypothetical protein